MNKELIFNLARENPKACERCEMLSVCTIRIRLKLHVACEIPNEHDLERVRKSNLSRAEMELLRLIETD